ncbi:MAG: 7-cyano-7-deazaguanine synthase [Chloroflexota bacterium]|nr:7-cyano-7-deazaguanine synthase [Chloroflexota bacterium]
MAERAPVSSRVAALVSGLDSCIMTGLLAREYEEVTPLFIRAGLRWEDAELAALQRFFSALDAPAVRPIIELKLDVSALYGSHWSVGGSDVPDAQQPDEAWYLPGRNLLLLGAAALYGGVNETPNLAIGLLASNPFPDATTDFLRSLERTAGLAMDFSFSVLTPLGEMHKEDVIRAGEGMPVHAALSCASPVDGGHCGVCGKCGERRRGFIDAGVADPTDYVKLGRL